MVPTPTIYPSLAPPINSDRNIIGIAAFVSGDVGYAQSLFEELQINIEQVQADFPAITKIRQRLPQRLIEVNIAQTAYCYARWRKNRDSQLLDQMKKNIDQLQNLNPDLYEAHLLSAIWHFVRNRDIGSARAELRHCKGQRDGTWRYSDAFLLAYQGDLDQATKKYRGAFKHQIIPTVPFEVEEFICWVLEEEPDKIQLHFCLGLINYFAKRDWESALRDLEAFLSSPKSDQWGEAKRLARQYVVNIRGQSQSPQN